MVSSTNPGRECESDRKVCLSYVGGVGRRRALRPLYHKLCCAPTHLGPALAATAHNPSAMVGGSDQRARLLDRKLFQPGKYARLDRIFGQSTNFAELPLWDLLFSKNGIYFFKKSKKNRGVQKNYICMGPLINFPFFS